MDTTRKILQKTSVSTVLYTGVQRLQLPVRQYMLQNTPDNKKH